MTIAELIIHEFDTLENHISAAKSSRTLGLFYGESGVSANDKITQYMEDNNLNPNLYFGWDGIYYPYFEIKWHEAQ